MTQNVCTVLIHPRQTGKIPGPFPNGWYVLLGKGGREKNRIFSGHF